jgi:hypothetical protein
VRLARRRRGQQVAGASGARRRFERDEPLERPAIAARPAWLGEQVGVASVHDQVALVRGRAVDDVAQQLRLAEGAVLQRQEDARVARLAVAGVDHVQRRLHAARASLSDVARDGVDRRVQLGEPRRLSLRRHLRVQAAGVRVQAGQDVAARPERAEQIEVAGRIVVGVA